MADQDMKKQTIKNMDKTFSVEKCVQLINEKFETSALASLTEYIRIPNLSRSYDPEWATNGLLEKAAQHIKDWVDNLGLEGLSTQIIKDEGFSPIIFTEIQGTLPYTIFYYGHFDKQPPFTGWLEGYGPTTPVLKDGKLYGRGGADDGYSTYSTMLSIWALQKLGVKLPRCVMITEGDEESGNHIDHYLDTLKDKIGTPQIIFCLDSGTIDYESFTLTTSLRGALMFNLRTQILSEGIHSGDASGVVPSTFRILRQLIQRIQNAKTGELIKELQVEIPPNRYEEMYNFAQTKSQQFFHHFNLYNGAKRAYESPLESVKARNWMSQLEITGADGIPAISGAGNVLRPETALKLSIRLPPTLKAQQAFDSVQKLLTTNTPYNATVQIYEADVFDGWNSPLVQDYLNEAIEASSQAIFNAPVVKMGEGGSIPLMNKLQELFPKAQFLITGVLGPQANAHGPNEFLHVPYCKKLTSAMSIILRNVSAHLESKKQ